MNKQKMCKTCQSALVLKPTKKSAAQLQKPYYYTAYYYCNHCQKMYFDDRFKVVNHPTTPLPFIMDKNNDNDTHFDVSIWTDGSCTHNGTPRAKAAWAFVSGETERAELVDGKQTNNVAEGLAIYYALVWAAEAGYKKIQLHTDSQISLFNLKKPARLVKVNREIFEDIEKVVRDNRLVITYVKVLGHSGDPNNERADRLANGLVS
jgi:ribonuclease HI